MSLGPVQVLVVGFEQPTPSGEALAELTRLEAAGVVRLLDLVVVRRGADGELETVDDLEGVAPGSGRVAAALFAGDPEEGHDDAGTWSLRDAVPERGVAAVALLEHLWAAPLREAIARAGGSAREETWLAAADIAVLESLLDR
jgi:hypothetical protein